MARAFGIIRIWWGGFFVVATVLLSLNSSVLAAAVVSLMLWGITTPPILMLVASRPSAFGSFRMWKVGAFFLLDSRRVFRSVGLAKKGPAGRLIYPEIVLQYPRGSHIFFLIRLAVPGQTVLIWQKKTDAMRAATGLDLAVHAIPNRPDFVSLVVQIEEPFTAVRIHGGEHVE